MISMIKNIVSDTEKVNISFYMFELKSHLIVSMY